MSLDDAIKDATRILDAALVEHLGDRELVATVVLFSGGNDSSVLFDLMLDLGRVTHVAHANTTIGIEETRQHVRDITAAAGLPLLEREPPVSYEDLVLAHGFPGPGQHYKMFQRLKDRPLRVIRRELVTNGFRQRVLYVAGRRRAESARRSDIPEAERVDSVIWASPLANWSNENMSEYRELRNLKPNPVAEKLGMSGECLCGAFAEPGELLRIAEHYPEAAAKIANLEGRLLAEGMIAPERCRWGWGAYRGWDPADIPETGPLCSSCDFRSDPAARLNLSPEESERVRATHARIVARRTTSKETR